MMPIHTAIDHHEEFFGKIRTSFAKNILEQRIMKGEEVPGKMNRIRKAHPDLLLQGFHNKACPKQPAKFR